MREFAFIDAIRRCLGPPRPPFMVGVGDDAAVLAASKAPQVVTTDTQIDGVHFRLEWLPPRGVGARAVEITISDLAAMGARPRALFAALNLPRSMPARDALALARGICARAHERACPVGGGNVAVHDGPLALTLSAIGEIPAGRRAFLRSGARPGHGVYATGMPGISRIGLEALTRGLRVKRGAPMLIAAAVRHFLEPRARLEEIEFLASLAAAELGAVIDLSDGLAGDLGHVLEASGVGADIRLPPHLSFVEACRALDLSPEDVFLGPSDDYELLFTAPPKALDRLAPPFRRRFRRELVKIGEIRRARCLRFIPASGRPRRIRPRAYEHNLG